MRVLAVLLVLVSLSATAFKEKSAMKTKKYKCFVVEDDEEVRVVKKNSFKVKSTPKYSRERPYSRELKSRSSEDIEVPQARVKSMKIARPRTITTTAAPSTLGPTPPNYPKEVKRDSQGRPLVLSPEHCNQVKTYATNYGVKDVLGWVKQNCRMAQMFVPGATCEDINTLVESCYHNKFL